MTLATYPPSSEAVLTDGSNYSFNLRSLLRTPPLLNGLLRASQRTATLEALAEMAEKDRLVKPLPTDPLTRAVLSNAAATVALLRVDWNALTETQRRVYNEIAEYARWDELPTTPLLEHQCCGTTSWTSEESIPNQGPLV
jgi:hypothetical protein